MVVRVKRSLMINLFSSKMRNMTPLDRFFNKIKVNHKTDCWEWVAYRHKGYARFNTGERVLEAHRWVYEQLVGRIPKGLHIDHLCRVRHCVNPYHMEPVTNHENMLRGKSIVAKRAAQTHCSRGHELTGNNLSITTYNGKHRRCLKCHAFRERIRRERIRNASV